MIGKNNRWKFLRGDVEGGGRDGGGGGPTTAANSGIKTPQLEPAHAPQKRTFFANSDIFGLTRAHQLFSGQRSSRRAVEHTPDAGDVKSED